MKKYRSFQEALSQPLQKIKGVGPVLAQKFAQQEIFNLGNLIDYFPGTYTTYISIPIDSLSQGPLDYSSQPEEEPERELRKNVVTKGVIISTHILFFKGRRVLEVRFGAQPKGECLLRGRWFNFNRGQAKGYRPGALKEIRGKLQLYQGKAGGGFMMIHPKVRQVRDDDAGQEEADLQWEPGYKGLKGISDQRIQRLVKEALSMVEKEIVDWMPKPIRENLMFPPLAEALFNIHQINRENSNKPDPEREIKLARERLAFEELCAWLAGRWFNRQRRMERRAAHIPFCGQKMEQMSTLLPFTLTAAQKRVVAEIGADLEQNRPMYRLLQGDTGCGKTVLALLASFAARTRGLQVAVMAPTLILANQWYANCLEFSGYLGLESDDIRLLTGQTPLEKKRIIARELKDGSCSMVIGTHALFQEKVQYHKLSLVVIDEQHRFGVSQRSNLVDKGRFGGQDIPHLLVMSATPIPRTLAMGLMADLDLSVVDELPPGRKPVITRVYEHSFRQEAFELIFQQAKQGHQVFFICPLIEQSDQGDLKDVQRVYQVFCQRLFKNFTVDLLHGRMTGDEKEVRMAAFCQGKTQILVSTTVVEVGVDVPRATVMAIEHAERFGLAQLHQMRGRVGRGGERSYCLLLTGQEIESESLERLRFLEQCADGFAIARHDMEKRGIGQFLGVIQSGSQEFKVARFPGDEKLLENAARHFAEISGGGYGTSLLEVLQVEAQQRWQGDDCQFYMD